MVPRRQHLGIRDQGRVGEVARVGVGVALGDGVGGVDGGGVGGFLVHLRHHHRTLHAHRRVHLGKQDVEKRALASTHGRYIQNPLARRAASRPSPGGTAPSGPGQARTPGPF
jgi:hypothetical protein